MLRASTASRSFLRVDEGAASVAARDRRPLRDARVDPRDGREQAGPPERGIRGEHAVDRRKAAIAHHQECRRIARGTPAQACEQARDLVIRVREGSARLGGVRAVQEQRRLGLREAQQQQRGRLRRLEQRAGDASPAPRRERIRGRSPRAPRRRSRARARAARDWPRRRAPPARCRSRERARDRAVASRSRRPPWSASPAPPPDARLR